MSDKQGDHTCERKNMAAICKIFWLYLTFHWHLLNQIWLPKKEYTSGLGSEAIDMVAWNYVALY